MSTVKQLYRSSAGFVSPYFVVDAGGNLLTQTITVTGNRLELAKNTFISYNGQKILSGDTLGAGITNIAGRLNGLTVAGDITVTGNINIQGAVLQGGPESTVTGEINNVNLGNVTPGVGRFTTLASTGVATVSITNTGTVTISPTGTVTISPTGSTTIAPTVALNLGALGTPVNLVGNLTAIAGQSVSLNLTGGGTFALNSVATGSINNTAVGQITAAAGRFTFARLTAPDELFGNDVSQVATKRYVEQAYILGYFAAVSAR